uniref:Metalloendopeptidase n=1 Tax=Pristhesancus plagipennis TaxID=1955184 RepID=A0A1Q1NPA0_PRIPG|nr:venom astacin-like protein 3 [Pristhesancus plagipennis]
MLKFLIVIIAISFVQSYPLDNEDWSLICQQNGERCILKGHRDIPESLIIEEDIIMIEDESRNAVKDPARKWPNATVPYVLHEQFNQDSVRRIEAAMRSIEKETCIKFIPYNDKMKVQYLRIVDGKKCHSTIGYSKDEDRIVILHEQKCLGRIGKIQHELLHTLGLLHEQARPDRDRWVQINWDNIIEGKKYNFEKASEKEYTTFGLDYNFESVMHYSPYSFSINKKVPTIIPKVKVDINLIGQRKAATPMDLKKLRLMYGCKSK